MRKVFCDRCEKEIENERDVNKLQLVNCETNKPVMKKMEICVFCTNEIKPIIRTKEKV